MPKKVYLFKADHDLVQAIEFLKEERGAPTWPALVRGLIRDRAAELGAQVNFVNPNKFSEPTPGRNPIATQFRRPQ